MALVELSHAEAPRIAAALERHGAVQAYALGDLDPFFLPWTRWLAWEEDGELAEVALVYSEPDPPVLHALTAGPVDRLRALLTAARDELPGRVYAHLAAGLVDPPPAGLVLAEPAVAHRKMALAHRGAVAHHARGDVEILRPEHRDELHALYAAAYPRSWFEPRLLGTGRYVGRRRGGELVAVAGVHVYSPAYRVAALGNVATHPGARGEGHATELCAHLCLLLADDGIETIGLNVVEGNAPALAVYERLGFEEVARFDEVTLVVPEGSRVR